MILSQIAYLGLKITKMTSNYVYDRFSNTVTMCGVLMGFLRANTVSGVLPEHGGYPLSSRGRDVSPTCLHPLPDQKNMFSRNIIGIMSQIVSNNFPSLKTIQEVIWDR